MLMFFTTWSFVVLIFFFGLATLASARRVHRDGREKRRRESASRKESGKEIKQKAARSSKKSSSKPSAAAPIPLLDAAAVALLHVALPSSLIVVALTWLVLVPMLLSSPDKARVALTRAMFFNFASYCQHGLNALFAIGDVFLNRVPHFLPDLSGSLLSFYSSVYGVWALSLGRVGIWLYPFLNAHKPWAAVAYSGLFLSNWISFFFAWGVFKLRDKLVGRTS